MQNSNKLLAGCRFSVVGGRWPINFSTKYWKCLSY